MRCLLAISVIINSVQPLSIVVYLSLVGKSHVDFVSALINILVERGHEVTFGILPLSVVEMVSLMELKSKERNMGMDVKEYRIGKTKSTKSPKRTKPGER
ncbi:hypothetical protein Aduo_011299 [Ancylostoma duodenale]